MTVINLAYTHCLPGNWQNAEVLYTEALATSLDTGSKGAEAFSLVGHFLVHRAAGRVEESLSSGRSGLVLAR